MRGAFDADDELLAALKRCDDDAERDALTRVWVEVNERYWPEYARRSPGGWTPPDDCRPGWNWTPPDGLVARTWRLPWWVKAWHRTPLIDRFAYEWMWHHGAFDVLPPDGTPGDPSGDRVSREPNSPLPEVSGEFHREHLQTHQPEGYFSDGLADRLKQRLASVHLLPNGAETPQLSLALENLSQRMRYALGEYETPPSPTPA